MLLEIHVVEEADGAPEILVFAVAPGHVAQAGRNRLAMLAQAFAFHPLVEEGPRLRRQRPLDLDGTFFRCGEFQLVPSVAAASVMPTLPVASRMRAGHAQMVARGAKSCNPVALTSD